MRGRDRLDGGAEGGAGEEDGVGAGVDGVLAEALSDTVCRLLPLSAAEAIEMIAAIRAASLLDAFRGESAVDRAGVADVLLKLSELASAFPERSI